MQAVVIKQSSSSLLLRALSLLEPLPLLAGGSPLGSLEVGSPPEEPGGPPDDPSPELVGSEDALAESLLAEPLLPDPLLPELPSDELPWPDDG